MPPTNLCFASAQVLDVLTGESNRRQADIGRLHDLRHTHTSYAMMNGVPVPVVSRLLGHADAGMTLLRYAHLGDREFEAAAERVGRSEP